MTGRFLNFRQRFYLIFLIILMGSCSFAGKPAGGISGCLQTNSVLSEEILSQEQHEADEVFNEVTVENINEDNLIDVQSAFEKVSVSHERQMRGVWVATVFNINWPKKNTDSVANMKNDLINMLDKMQNINMNAIFFQVRPEADALYKSNIEPWSRYLTGTQGKAPADNFDPLNFLVKEAHLRGIEVHAWLNPYRAAANADNSFAATHVSQTMGSDVVRYGNLLWMDPGSSKTMDHTYRVVMDIVNRYDVDGIHFDDYFYPYPISGVEFPDDKTWNAYKNAGGKLSKGDWRRNNVNRLIKKVYDGIKKAKPHVRFGISPFGIYRPGIPEGITGLDQYSQLYADPKYWLEAGIVDYLAPQLYWSTTSTGQNYYKLLDWWLSVNPLKKDIYIGHNLVKLGDEGWTVNEFRKQLQAIKERKLKMANGSIMYHVANIVSNKSGITDTFKNEFWSSYVLMPPIPGDKNIPAEPVITGVKNNTVSIVTNNNLKGFGIYKKTSSSWKFTGLSEPSKSSFTLEDGIYAITGVSRSGLESKGVVINVAQPVPPESISFSNNNVDIFKGGVRSKARLTVEFYPSNTTLRELQWASNNPLTVTVSENGVITAVNEGDAEIMATTVSGGHEAFCNITVIDDGIIYGDVDGDSTINVSDAIIVLRHIVGLTAIPEEYLPAADVAGDGSVNVGDAIKILRYIVGLY